MKKLLVLLAFAVALFGCGGSDGLDGVNGKSCTIKGNLLICPDGTSATIFDGSSSNASDTVATPEEISSKNCTVFEVGRCAEVICDDGTSTKVCPVCACVCDVEKETDDPDKVIICHKPGTPAEKTMLIPETALEGHLQHGDYLGSCEEGE